LQGHPGVGFAQRDMAWLERLQTITGLVERGVVAISIMLVVAVLAIVGNTIRLNIAQNRDAIAIARLVGATDAWIRRPYLYLGLYQGLAGALVAGLIVAAVLAYLAPLATRLSSSYGIAAAVAGVAPAEGAALLAAGVTLGLGAAWLAVISQLRSLD
ncbi:MAG: cell division protein, partial [Gammaproteobacteria bacterium]|nr:cell division protein [Gammaproteobacteria bacterium]